MKKKAPDFIENVWQFISAEISPKEFEKWFYQTEALESEMPADLHFEVMSFNYNSHTHVELNTLKNHLKAWLDSSYF